MTYFRAALACAAGLIASSFALAATAGNIRIDDPRRTYSEVATCTLGDMACASFTGPGYQFGLPDGTTTNRLYVYREGIIGLGSPVAGSVIGGVPVITSTGYYVAPGYGLIPNVQHVLSLNMILPTAFVIDWMTPTGIFQALFTHFGDGGFGTEYMQLDFNAGGPFPGKPGDPSYGDPRGEAYVCGAGAYSIGSGRTSHACSGRLNAGVPEPATWALMILGLGAAGGQLRRRRLSVKA
jgi:hypothetical protein